MTGMKEREKAFEEKFAHDSELQFKAEAARNRLVGQWAAGLFGLSHEDTAAYIKSLVAADMEEAGDGDVMRKLLADFATYKVSITEAELRTRLDEAMLEAKTALFAKSS